MVRYDINNNNKKLLFWIHSNRSDINRLFEYLGNQIVFLCRKTIKMSDLFSGNTESILEKLQISMDCCKNYVSAYTKVKSITNFLILLYDND